MKRILSIVLSASLLLSTGILAKADTTETESDLGVSVDITPSYLNRVTESTNDDGETVYTSGTWNDGSITFDYLIEKDYIYVITFDYMGHSYAGNQIPSASTVASATTPVNGKKASVVPLNVPSSKTAWTSVKRTLKGADLLASGGTYLAIHWSQVDPESNFKNFKIMKLKCGSNSLIPTTLHNT